MSLVSVLEKTQSPEGTAPPLSMEESLSVTVTDTQAVAHNYMDCTESNDEEEEEEEEHEGQGDAKPAKEEVMKEPEEKMEEEGKENCHAPKWEDFFTTEMLTDSQNSQSHSCCSVTSPSRMTGSQTPELFSDEEPPGNDENFSLTLSASLSNHSSQNMDSCLPDTLILAPEQREQGNVRTSMTSQKEENDGLILQPELDEVSDSQASSDFNIPCTPESKVPQPDELLQLYRKLASGEELPI